MNKKYVYLFSEGNSDMKDLLGGKGANLAEMTHMGIPVPQGFTITTEACSRYFADSESIGGDIEREIFENIRKLENITGKKFGSTENPLLLSVRSGAGISMPGMMDTILNLGLNDEVVNGLLKQTNNPRFVFDLYRRFIQMYSDIVMKIDRNNFEQIIENIKKERKFVFDSELNSDDMERLTENFKAVYRKETGKDFPQNPDEQLIKAIDAVFASWNNKRAKSYRKMNNIPEFPGTAVNVQSMVFGNIADTSGTGVAFTRNPSNGEKQLFGEFLQNAQGEDIVAGIRTPQSIEKLKDIMPEIYGRLDNIGHKLENFFKDMQEMEFTIENGKLYLLQTRTGKRTAAAAFKIAFDLSAEGVITEECAAKTLTDEQLKILQFPCFDKNVIKNLKPFASALPASPGSASGKVVFDSFEAEDLGEEGEKIILVKTDTSPDDLEAISCSQGVLTVHGGMTSHAAVIARSMGICCVSGCENLKVDEENECFELNGRVVNKGDIISLDGTTGNIYEGEIPMVAPEMSEEVKYMTRLIQKYR